MINTNTLNRIINDIIRRIETSTEEEIKSDILEDAKRYEKAIMDNNYHSLLEYLKGDIMRMPIYTDYIWKSEYETAKPVFKKIINSFHITNVDIDKELDYIRDKASMNLARCSKWKFSDIPLVDINQKNETLRCCMAFFRYKNKWGRQEPKSISKIIYNRDMEIVWIKNDAREIKYFLSANDKIYGLGYDHKKGGPGKILDIYCDIKQNIPKIEIDADFKNIDDVIRKHENVSFLNEPKWIDLDDFFEKGFFYKGPKWVNEHPPKDITIIKSVTPSKGYFKLEIENITYPHKGYVLLDISNCTAYRMI